jgi:hypothetical protein
VVGPAIQLIRQGSTRTALAAATGDYEITFADGRSQKLSVTVPAPQTLSGPWEVQFASGVGAPESVTFDPLGDWTQRPEARLQHFSGKATYRKAFELAAPGHTNPASRIILNLGEVRDLATVRVNGKNLGTLWCAPWRVDITESAKPGENTLEVEIINAWNNRLVGDAALPAERRRTFLLAPTVKPDAPLLPAGLLGPVAVRYAVGNVVR